MMKKISNLISGLVLIVVLWMIPVVLFIAWVPIAFFSTLAFRHIREMLGIVVLLIGLGVTLSLETGFVRNEEYPGIVRKFFPTCSPGSCRGLVAGKHYGAP